VNVNTKAKEQDRKARSQAKRQRKLERRRAKREAEAIFPHEGKLPEKS